MDIALDNPEEKHDLIVDPELQRKIIENKKLDQEWSGCCSRTDKDYLKYIIQVAVLALILVFSLVQVIREAPNKEIYFSLISTVIGIFAPQPTIKS